MAHPLCVQGIVRAAAHGLAHPTPAHQLKSGARLSCTAALKSLSQLLAVSLRGSTEQGHGMS